MRAARPLAIDVICQSARENFRRVSYKNIELQYILNQFYLSVIGERVSCKKGSKGSCCYVNIMPRFISHQAYIKPQLRHHYVRRTDVTGKIRSDITHVIDCLITFYVSKQLLLYSLYIFWIIFPMANYHNLVSSYQQTN